MTLEMRRRSSEEERATAIMGFFFFFFLLGLLPFSMAVELFNPSKLQMFVDELPAMPVLQGYGVKDGLLLPGNLTVGMYETTWKFHRDLPATRVFAYGTDKASATVPGPTIEALVGVPTTVTWQNHLPSRHILPLDPTIPSAAAGTGVPTVVHLHGGVHSPASDGNSGAWFTANFSSRGPAWSSPTYTYPNVQEPGNLWYHDHALGLTRVNILAGLAGAFNLRDPAAESSLRLPSLDRNLVVFDRTFFADGSIFMNATGVNPTIHPHWQPEYFGDAIIVNGKAWPFLRVPAKKHRFRILNASNARFLHLFFTNGLNFTFIGSDSVYLRRPVTTSNFLLAPSEIADVVVDFAESGTPTVVLANDAPYPYPSGDPADELSGKVMRFIITGKRGGRSGGVLPKKLLTYPSPVVAAARPAETRYITMYEYESAAGEPTHLFLNGKSFEAAATELPRAGTSEVWHVINLTEDDHPLHVHLGFTAAVRQVELVGEEEFKACMMRINDAVRCHVADHAVGRVAAIPRYERGWKNVVKVPAGFVTTVVVRFALLRSDSVYPFDATVEPGYVYHCHILDHEDNEMMRPLKLKP